MIRRISYIFSFISLQILILKLNIFLEDGSFLFSPEILSTQKIEQANRYNGIKDVNAVW